jgi:Holliday junction DNA helicase RuvB
MNFPPLVELICIKCGKTFFNLYADATLCWECSFPDVEKNKAQEVILKPEMLDTSKLKRGCGRTFWRPETFDQYIGQDSLKRILAGYISGCKKLNKTFPHFLVDGKAGTGKTTIAYILAKQLGVPFVECVANTLQSNQQLIDKIAEADGGVLFIDEIHVISKRIANFALPLLEDFQVNGQSIKPFSVFACTTELGNLIKKYKPLVDRMKIQKTLDPYTLNELTTITRQYKEKNFLASDVSENIFIQIAKNCRNTPRIAIRLLESFVYMNTPFENVLKDYGIVRDGITAKDIQILKILSEKENGLGLKTLCAFLGTSEENYLYQIEGYLIEQGLITIGNKRQITNLGKQFLNDL